MYYSESQLNVEIAALVNGSRDRNVAISPDSVALAVILNHLPDFKRGEGFTDFCVWSKVRDTAGNYITRVFKDDDGELVQKRLPGFTYVQQYYIVPRNGQNIAVPVVMLTMDEGERIVRRMLLESATKAAHADELKQFLMRQQRPGDESSAA